MVTNHLSHQSRKEGKIMQRDIKYKKDSQPSRPIAEEDIYNAWLALTNGGDECPEFHNSDNELVLTVADEQVFCTIPQHDNAESVAQAICLAGDIISHLKNRVLTLEKEIELKNEMLDAFNGE